ncbi:hypothetical protein BU16DRAFT_342368 [Lophium mytilinum]|uniref:Uncharacterized protein n=1 Tax=Lophium mytilinum TaxID=390894 RepID=A0A6A6QWK6_9PEZI|nr:hypothetical protein BU16DRAFT_342368 [Lophium mytilinum]
MADPLSVTVGILALIGAAGKTVQGLEKAWELRHIDEDFMGLSNQVTGLKTQLYAVKSSLQLFESKDFSHHWLRDSVRDTTILCGQAESVLAEIDKFVQDITSKSRRRLGAAVENKPSKKRWIRRKPTLIRLSAKVTPIVNSLTVAAGVLRAIASDEKINKIDLKVTFLAVQKIEMLRNASKTATTIESAMPLENQLEVSIRQATEPSETRMGCPGQASRRSSIDSFHSAVSSSSESTPRSLSSIVSISGTMGDATCEPFCPCQCHVSSQVRTPQWAKHILGTMTFHGNGSIFLNRRPCNKSCGRSGPTSIQFSYFAPAWTLLTSLNIFVKAQSIHGFNIRMPRVIPYSATVWSIIELGNLPTLKEMVSRNAISPYDVSPSGMSLLQCAAMKGQNDIYEYLLFLKADPDFRDGTGNLELIERSAA